MTNGPERSEALGQVEVLAEVLGGAVRLDDAKVGDALGSGGREAASVQVGLELFAQGVGGCEEESGALRVDKPVYELVTLAGPRGDHKEVSPTGDSIEHLAKPGGGFVRREQTPEGFLFFLEEGAKEREVREERAVKVRKPGTEPADLGNGQVIERALGGLAGLLLHALDVGSAARSPGRAGDDGRGPFCFEAGSPQRSPQRPRAAVQPTLAPSFGGQMAECIDHLVIGFVVGGGLRRRARSGGPPLDGFAVRLGALATGG